MLQPPGTSAKLGALRLVCQHGPQGQQDAGVSEQRMKGMKNLKREVENKAMLEMMGITYSLIVQGVEMGMQMWIVSPS